MTNIVIINSEGKYDDNYYLIDGMTLGVPKFLSIYIIEQNGMRLMIDVGEALKARKIIKKLKDFGLYPIHKIVLTHSHWDHAQGISKLYSLMKDSDVEVLASENAVENLKNPEKMIKGFEGIEGVYPFEEVIPLKEGDIIDINGLKLEVINFFGHTMDNIALFDKSNRNIFVGDSILNRLDQDAFSVPLMPPDFHEEELLKTFNKLRKMKNELNSISLGHFGVWKDNHFEQILNEMEDLYFKVKNSLIKWYNENPSIDYITNKYFKTLIPNSKVWNEKAFVIMIEMMINGLKLSEFIKAETALH
ncbi:MAG: MBL fold metallo-hydrolase [Candidatus Lokiarchaeota archaeon]|nr:MBL fold metallo-hydrolase [Candidatus Lokiarchaeota archaeon]